MTALARARTSRTGPTHLVAGARTFCGEPLLTGLTYAGAEVADCVKCRDVAAAAIEEDEKERSRDRWLKGDLRHLLDATQTAMRAQRDAIWTAPVPFTKEQLAALPIEERVRRANVSITFFENCARGLGKSFEELVWLVEGGRTINDGRLLYAAPLREDATTLARDIMEMFILPTCPEEIKPQWRAGDGDYFFPGTNAILRFRGTENESRNRLRGPGYHRAVLDEVAVMSSLKSVLGIVEPIASRLKGKVILSTTPPETPGHESKEIYEEHVARGAAVTFTLLDNARLSWDEKAAVLLQGFDHEDPADVPAILAGTLRPKRTKTRREYWCEWIIEGEAAVHPAWTDLESELTVQIARAA